MLSASSDFSDDSNVSKLSIPEEKRAVSSIERAITALASMASSTRSKLERRLKGGAARSCHWEVGRA